MRISDYLKDRTYPGRILIGGTLKNGRPVVAYALMGRSEKSRNRVLVFEDQCLTAMPYDPEGESGDSLTLYVASYCSGNYKIYANGSHGKDIKDALDSGKTFLESLDALTPEPDALNTPRIALVYSDDGSYSLLIVRKDEKGEDDRVVWNYQNTPGYGHVIHTYAEDAKPFDGDPALISFGDKLTSFVEELWDSLDEENKVSLFVGYEGAGRVHNKRVW